MVIEMSLQMIWFNPFKRELTFTLQTFSQGIYLANFGMPPVVQIP